MGQHGCLALWELLCADQIASPTKGMDEEAKRIVPHIERARLNRARELRTARSRARITVYANPAHTWIVVAGIALDTAAYGGPSVPTGSVPRWRSEPLANLGDGARYTVRHPAGL